MILRIEKEISKRKTFHRRIFHLKQSQARTRIQLNCIYREAGMWDREVGNKKSKSLEKIVDT